MKIETNLKIKWGKPIMMLSWRTIESIIHATISTNLVCITFSLGFFLAAVRTKMHIGDYLNMVTDNDGTMLPLLLAISALLALPVAVTGLVFLHKSKSKTRERSVNKILFGCVLSGLFVFVSLLSMAVIALVHSYHIHDRLHDGIVDSMQAYGTDLSTKKKMDVLQFELQCCGSKTYKEWFDIPWMEPNKTETTVSRYVSADDAPFSCCSVDSLSPCIHHDVISGSGAYVYAPETNLTLSDHGCHTVLHNKTKIVAWKVACALFSLGVVQILACIGTRIVQTGHTEKYRFDRNSFWHTAWIFGCYRGKGDKPTPPKVPPLPEELLD